MKRFQNNSDISRTKNRIRVSFYFDAVREENKYVCKSSGTQKLSQLIIGVDETYAPVEEHVLALQNADFEDIV